MAIAYAVLRASIGIAIGFPLFLALTAAGTVTTQLMIASFALPRFILAAVLIHFCFRPRGGRAETIVWALVSVAAASAIDVFILSDYAQKAGWLRMSWC